MKTKKLSRKSRVSSFHIELCCLNFSRKLNNFYFSHFSLAFSESMATFSWKTFAVRDDKSKNIFFFRKERRERNFRFYSEKIRWRKNFDSVVKESFFLLFRDAIQNICMFYVSCQKREGKVEKSPKRFHAIFSYSTAL